MSSPLTTPDAILADILSEVGERPERGAIRFHGSDPVLATPFRIGELGAAAIGAAALQVAEIHAERTGIAQEVDVDVDAAAVAMRSSRQLVVDPPPLASAMRPVGSYRTRDGRWLFTQRLFPHHFERQLEVLGCTADEDAITEAVARHDGAWLEEAMVEKGASAALVRTRREWAAHPQSAAIASLPLLEITQIGETVPGPLPTGIRPLSGLRVLDLTRVLAGPTCARTLAEQGADVLRISSPRMPDDPRMMIDTGHGKRSTVLDLRDGAELEILRGLIAEADVFVQGYRPGAIAAFGLSPAELAVLRPGIISVSLTAFGRLGPWSGRRGFDSIVQSVSGIVLPNGDGEPPRWLPANPLDYTTGYLAAFGVLAALRRRARDGGSYHVEVSLAQTGHYLDGLPLADAALAASRPGEPGPEILGRLLIDRETEFGLVRHLAPVARFPETPAYWEFPSVPADHDEPRWAAKFAVGSQGFPKVR